MKSSKLAALFTAAVALGLALPALAADKSSGVETAVDGVMFVPRAGAAAVGTVVGTPIAVVRETYKWYTTMTPEWADKVGGKDCGPACALISLVSLPASIVAGTATGSYYGVRNGMVKGFNAPFSQASFSLGKDVEE